MSQLRQSLARFEKAGAQIVAIGMGDPTEAREFKKQMAITFPLLSDTRQATYSATELGQINPQEEIKPKNIGALFQQFARGNFGGVPVGKIRQLGGTIIVDTSGTIRYLHRSRSASENAPIKELFEAVSKI